MSGDMTNYSSSTNHYQSTGKHATVWADYRLDKKRKINQIYLKLVKEIFKLEDKWVINISLMRTGNFQKLYQEKNRNPEMETIQRKVLLPMVRNWKKMVTAKRTLKSNKWTCNHWKLCKCLDIHFFFSFKVNK